MINSGMIRLIRNGGTKFQPAFFALVMSLGILSISSLLNGFVLLSLTLFYTAVAVFIAEAVLLLAAIFMGGSRQICGTSECNYGAFTISSGMSVLLTRHSMAGMGNSALDLAANFAILIILVMVIRPGLLGRIRNSGNKVDTAFSNYSIAILAYSIALLHSFPDGTYYSELIAFGAVFAGILSMFSFFMFQGGLFSAYTSERLHGINTDGSLFINMGFPALSIIFFSQFLLSFHGFLSHELESLLLFIELGLWIYSTVWYPIAIWLYTTKNRTHSFSASKFAIVFPTGVYSTATYIIFSTYLHNLYFLSFIILIAGIIVLLMILAELAYPLFTRPGGAENL